MFAAAAAAHWLVPDHGWLSFAVWVLACVVALETLILWEVRRDRRSDRFRARMHAWTRDRH